MTVTPCKKCGTLYIEPGYNLCVKCQSEQLYPECWENRTVDEDGHDYRVPVPYCKKSGKRLVIEDGLLCEGCSNANNNRQ